MFFFPEEEQERMPVLTGNKKSAKHIKLRRPRCQFNQHATETTTTTDPIRRPSKSTIASVLLSTLSPNNNDTTGHTTSRKNKTKNFAFKGLGCKAVAVAERVSVPDVIRSSAEWDSKKTRKKKKKNNGKSGVVIDGGYGCGSSAACAVVVPDVLCGPGIGFSAADDAAPVDCVVARRNVGGRIKIDLEKISQRERSSHLARRSVHPEVLSFLDSDPDIVSTYPEQEVFGTRYHSHARHLSPGGFAEIMVMQGSLMRGERLDVADRHSSWRLDVDNMSYEELLELGEKIGHVNTGLKENEISHLLKKFNLSKLSDLSSQLPMQFDSKCSICQEEYEVDDEIGKLNCGHGYHIQCIKKWLQQKNACPVCKIAPVVR